MLFTRLVTLAHLLKYYQEYNEDTRLLKNNQHQTEFLVTANYLQKYLQEGTNVLDVGSGPGIYSIFCAEEGLDVTALDLSERNLKGLQVQIKNKPIEKQISMYHGNAKDLSAFDDNAFDLVLNMGPLYHLKHKEEKQIAINESLRVLKPGGVLLVAYINKYFKFYQRILKQDEPIKWQVIENIVNFGWKRDTAEAIFFFLFPHEAKALFESHKGKILHHVSTDGISPLLADAINAMTPVDFDKYMHYHLQFCEDPHLLGASLHNLLIFQKEG